ncbi:MAG: 4Fe-4S binding protein [Proteobacteria bacterium]|nr:4Fe-4S binding protein [Pseudomonadota bacterium]MBU1740550.1 4Fe-4S binding protein [Pseudomonadota bacterium]
MEVVSTSRDSRPDGESGIVSFFPLWCKRCGNCVEFCPRGALAQDEQKRPFLDKPERCTKCGLCEMLCPDFAICVAEEGGPPAAHRRSAATMAGEAAPSLGPYLSPERLARAPENGKNKNG